MRTAQIQEVGKQTHFMMRRTTCSHCKGYGFREKRRIRSIFIISLPESEWSVSEESPFPSPSLFWISKRKHTEVLRAACRLLASMREANMRTRTTHRKDRTKWIAEEKCHSPLDHVDIWIKSTLPLDFRDTNTSKFCYHSSPGGWSFLWNKRTPKWYFHKTITFSSPLKLHLPKKASCWCFCGSEENAKICKVQFLVGKSKFHINESKMSYSTEIHICDFNPIFLEYSRVWKGHLKISVIIYCLLWKKITCFSRQLLKLFFFFKYVFWNALSVYFFSVPTSQDFVDLCIPWLMLKILLVC